MDVTRCIPRIHTAQLALPVWPVEFLYIAVCVAKRGPTKIEASKVGDEMAMKFLFQAFLPMFHELFASPFWTRHFQE